MGLLDALPAAVFWISFAAVFYTYFGFGLLLAALTLRRKLPRPAPPPDDALPTVSFIIPARNEQAVIEEKLRNCLLIDYPPEKLTFLVISDQSTDDTNQIILRNRHERIRPYLLERHTGKIGVMQMITPQCEGEILVCSDANTFYRPDAVRKLVRHFQDPEVGVATGDVRILRSEQNFGVGEGFYYRYERALQALESRYWSTVGIDGAMFAVRRRDFIPPPDIGVNDDLTSGMNVALQGLRIIYDPEAIAEEPPTPSDGLEFRRKARIVAYGIQSLLYFRDATPRVRQWRLFWVYMSHKALRWVAPLFLVAMLVAAAGGAAGGSAWWRLVAGLQLAFYGLGAIGWKCRAATGRLFRVPYYFSMMNLAALLGIFRGLRKGQASVWTKTDRNAGGRAASAAGDISVT